MLSLLLLLLASSNNPNRPGSLLAPSTPTGDAIPVSGWISCLTRDTGDVATLGCFPLIFQRFVISAFVLAGITAIIFIAYSGIKLSLAGGDAKKLGSARQTLMFAIIGLFVIFTAALVVSIIAYITGVSCINIAGFENCQ